MRPDRLVLVTGTTTGVGKTWTAASLATAWRVAGASVAARKPAQSFDAGEPGAAASDADVLAAATGEHPDVVCPQHRRYPLGMAPPIAAAELGLPAFTVADLARETQWPAGIDYGLVEGVGGPRSPLAADGDTVALALVLRPDDVVLVAGPGLGAINAVLLAADAFAPHRPTVLLNGFQGTDPLHRTNAEWLRRHSGLQVTTGVAELADGL